MYNVTSRQVTTKVIDFSLDGELARNLASLIETHHKTNDLMLDPKILYELENLTRTIRGHL
jgi:hypothetical protein